MPKVVQRKDTIAYFGYGVLVSKKMIAALLGRIPDHEPATLNNYRKYIQLWCVITPAIRSALAEVWGWKKEDNFSRYIIRPRKGSEVKGILWFLTKEELEAIGTFELEQNSWMTRARVLVQNGSNQKILAYAHILDKWNNHLIHGGFKKTFLNSYQNMISIAHKVRVTSEI